MSESSDATDERVTTDHDTIREWVTDRDGRPARIDDEAGAAGLGFRFDGDGEDLDWDSFFERFEAENLAFVHRPDADEGDGAWRLKRLSDTDDEVDELDQEQREAREAGREQRQQKTGDRLSEKRNKDAAEQENPDNHRDEAPFNT